MSVGIEAAMRPICGKGRVRADTGKTFSLYSFVDHDRDGERVSSRILLYEITDSDHSLGHGGGAPLLPKSIYRKKR